MHIEELTKIASLNFLAGSRLGRLACANQSQPYITPFYFAYQDQWIYSFSTVGQKIEWLRANPLACVEVDEITSPREWTSVVVFGRYEELAKTTDGQAPRVIPFQLHEEPTKSTDDQDPRELAFKLLQQRELWWEPGYTRTALHGTPKPLDPVYFRLSVDEISGHRATPK
jgi:uncharacterized protein